SHASGAELSIVHGEVVDAVTGEPLVNATILVWGVSNSQCTLKATTTTDTNGYYEVHLPRGFRYRIYTYHDKPESPGLDHLPALQSFYLGEETKIKIQFRLFPAASILFKGDILLVDHLQPITSVVFTVIDPKTGETPHINGGILVYGVGLGATPSHSQLMGLDSRQVVIPANTFIHIKVDLIIPNRTPKNHTFLIDEGFKLKQGEKVEVDVRKYSLRYNLEFVNEVIKLVENRLEGASQTGFYTVAEEGDLAEVRKLVSSAEERLANGAYEESFADLKEAYIKAKGLDETITSMYINASSSTSALILYLTFTALALAYLLLEKAAMRLLMGGLFYASLLALLYVVYPRCKLVSFSTFLQTVGASLIVILLVVGLFPRVFKEREAPGRIALRSAVASLFSMAKRNLKRRRIRSALTLASIIVLTMSFVAFTSFSMGYGLTITPMFRPPLSPAPPSEGVLIRQPISREFSSRTTFQPLEAEAMDWLQKQPEVWLVSPKAENVPSPSSLGFLTSKKTSTAIQILGIVGVSPRAEESVTHLNALVIRGRYLTDNDTNAVLISENAAERLGVKVGENLLFRGRGTTVELELVGTVDDESLSWLVDVDGSSFLPNKLVLLEERTYLEPCNPHEIIITMWHTALNFYGVFTSRVAALVRNSQDILPLARRAVLERGYWAWGCLNNQVYFARLGSYIEARGLTVVVPWVIVVLNVVIVLVNSIHERKGEISILSAIGLNPAHLTALFAFEALILGVVGAGIGYILGLGSYRMMTLFVEMSVRQKVSAVWCLAALGVAVMAVLAGSIFAIRTSVVATPSLLRRWRIEERPRPSGEWVLPLPIRILQDEVEPFMDYAEKALRSYQGEFEERIERIKRMRKETPKGIVRGIRFVYRSGVGMNAILTVNEFRLVKRHEERSYSAELASWGPGDKDVYKTANLIRKLILRYTAMKRRR
ncbi:MAG: ABC transporter permease, partial [Candidatus Freyarchaeota archaeon]